MGWFYGFKLHLIINHKGEILGTKLIAYCHKKDKPTIRIDESEIKTLCTI